jgi:hypothetical protein
VPLVQGLRSVAEVIAFSSQHSAFSVCLGDPGEQYEKLDQSTVEVKRMLAGLIKKVEAGQRAN